MIVSKLCTSEYEISDDGLLAHVNGISKFETIRDMYYTLLNNDIIWARDFVYYQGFQYTLCEISNIEELRDLFPEEFI